ncbi:MAG TPA: MaoC/PaaZ C-terminal domain-containing protein [Candidatus Didemnitutus sp.]|nr:MaoC/PaaZ C-terminal domain-containing protein [Candidatus Didemnitutus sp.]
MPDFLAFAEVGDRRYRERFGLDFEQFAVGQRFRHRPGLTLSQQDSRDECLDTLNQQMLHFDEAFARHTEWGRCLMDSTLTTKVLIGMGWKTFAKRVRLLRCDEITLTKPMFGGDTLYAESEILAVADWPDDARLGRLKIRTTGTNQDSVAVARVVFDLLVTRAGHDPLPGLGY